MLQTAISEGCALDEFTLGEDGFCPAEVDVSRDKTGEALVVASMVVMDEEGVDLPLQLAAYTPVEFRNV